MRSVIDILDLDPEKGEVDYTVIKNGQEISFAGIQVNDVLNVAMNKDKDRKHIEIIVSDKKISGNVTKMSSERDEITVDGEVYTVSEDFERFRLADGKTLSLGGEYTFYIDYKFLGILGCYLIGS